MLATTRVEVLRGTSSQNDFGDELEEAAVVPALADVPASITEVDRRVFDPDSGTWTTVRDYVGRLPGGVAVLDGDRLRDKRTGRTYIITEEEQTPRSISGRSSITLALRRIGS